MQGGSHVSSKVGSALHNVCAALKGQIAALATKEGSVFRKKKDPDVKAYDLIYHGITIALKEKPFIKVT